MLASKKIAEGVSIRILVRKTIDEAKTKKLEACIQLLDNNGIKVKQTDDVFQKIAIIDEKILWYGNVNYLGYTEIDECCMRIANTQIGSEIEAEIT